MKLSMYCARFITKFRVSNHRWKGTIPLLQKTSLLERRGTAQSFHSTPPLAAKSFQERENEFAHGVMQKIPSYGDSIVRTPISESSNRSSTQVVKDFVQDRTHLVFVYGTLKRGEPNHDLMEKGGAIYEGTGETTQRWPLVIASRYNIPFLLHCAGKGEHVIGELYRVDDAMLSSMDRFENHPDYYTRVREEVVVPGSSPLRPWLYFLLQYKEEMLDRPFLKQYASRGEHGLEYVQSEETSDPEDIYR